MKSQLPEGHENVVAVVINAVSHMACQTGDRFAISWLISVYSRIFVTRFFHGWL
jgi:hypothetical protein